MSKKNNNNASNNANNTSSNTSNNTSSNISGNTSSNTSSNTSGNTSGNTSSKQAATKEFNRLVAELQAHLDEPDIVRDIQGCLIEKNKGLIVKMVKIAEATNRPSKDGIQSGYAGFLAGLRCYDPSKGKSPSTYLATCVLNEARDYNLHNNLFNSSALTCNKSVVARAEKELSGDIDITALSPEAIRHWLRQNDPKNALSVKTINHVRRASRVLSFDAPVGVYEDGEVFTLADKDPDPHSRTPLDNLIERENNERVDRLRTKINTLLPSYLAHVFDIFYLNDSDAKRTAEELETTVDVINADIRQARKILRKQLSI